MRAVVFSGTSDGRQLAAYLNDKGINTIVCTATKYGGDIMPPMKNVEVRTGRMDENDIIMLIKNADIVIDATHPYAEEITHNIKNACRYAGIRLIRLIRAENRRSDVVYVKNTEQAVRLLIGTEGGIFVSTGSKELHKYADIPDYKNRLAVRVLPFDGARSVCLSLGIKNVIYEKGPFSFEQNVKHFSAYGARHLVTKSSGAEGGFDEKADAALSLGMDVIVIERPPESGGMTLDRIKLYIDGLFAPRFPLFVDIRGRRALVAGGGAVAERRVRVLLSFGADVTVVAPSISESIQKICADCICRPFDEKDITDDIFIVSASTNDRRVNHRIYEICRQRGIFVSVSDCPQECSFYFPAVCISDNISVGITSSNTDHTAVKNAAQKIRQVLNDEKHIEGGQP